MDTPDSKTPSTLNNNNNNNKTKLINPSSSDSPAVQDSPIFSFISNLSPIQPVKAAPVAQGFPGLASPPLAFTSPRISLQTSFLSRQLQSSTSNSEFSEVNDKFQKSDGHSFTKVDLSLKIPAIGDDENGCNKKDSLQVADEDGCNRKDLVQVADHNVSGFLDGHSANTSNKRLFVDSPKSFEGDCLVQKDNNVVKGKVPSGSALPKVTENVQAQRRPNFKLVKLEPGRFISTSSKCSIILPKSSNSHTSEVSQLECGTLRRCLFDGDKRKYMSELSDEYGSQNPNDNVRGIQEVPKNSVPAGAVKARQMINLSKPITRVCTTPTARNYPVPISKPLGIGLHLNSVVYPTRSTEKATSDQQSSEKIVTVVGKTSLPVASDQSAGKIDSSSLTTDLIERVPACSEEILKNGHSLLGASHNTLALDTAQVFEDPILLKPDDSCAVMDDKRRFNAEHVETNKKLPGSPKKKRKKSSSSPDDDTPKHCNCKRSKCLKLYCDCFAAGLYCAESCACQGCFNRAENEGTVLETRKQIESRNPLAFAPKVVKLETNSPASGMELTNLSTPSSARHKRGCNCKRSMCLKNYCECYQSNVGCSDGCRCEGCQNVYGKREEHSFVREFMIKKAAETRGSKLDEKEEGFSGRSDIIKSRLHSSPHVSPVTPALHCSDQKKHAPKSRLTFRRFLQSQDTNHDMLPSETSSATCPGNPPSSSTSLEQTGTSVDDISSSKPTDVKNGSSSLLRWRSSPMTPVSESSRSDEYLQDFDAGNKHSQSHLLEDDNDTPEILKDKATPAGSVHVRSPNKKRVSPPHYHHNKASPNSLKICHKYVLQSVPQFPSLTPFSRKSSTGTDNTSASLD